MVGRSAGGGEGVDGVEGGEVGLSRLLIASVCVVWFIAYFVQVGVLKRSRGGGAEVLCGRGCCFRAWSGTSVNSGEGVFDCGLGGAEEGALAAGV